MAQLRPVLLIALIFLGYMIWVQWQRDYAPEPVAETPQLNNDAAVSGDTPEPVAPAADIPSPEAITSSAQDTPVNDSAPQLGAGSPRITITTDVLRLEVDLVGGTLVTSELLDYPVTLENTNNKVRLFNDQGSPFFVAQSGIVSNTQAAPNHTARYQSDELEYVLHEGIDELRVPLRWRQDDIEVTKTFVLRRGRYDVEVRHYLSNNSSEAWTGSQYQQLQRTAPPGDEKPSFTNPGRYSYLGGAIYTPENKLEKLDFEEIAEQNYQVTSQGGWLGMIQHYFLAAWIPDAETAASYSTDMIPNGGISRYLVRAVESGISVSAGGQHEFRTKLFVGPKLQDQLDDIAPGLSLSVDYGIFTVLSKPLFWALSNIHKVVRNWGWSIVIVTILIKLLFFKLTEAQYRSMARMRKLQPRMEALKERYGDDRQKLSAAMMEMYRKEEVNPLGGCLPMLIQIPIFIALYWVLLESVELRQAPFIGWIQNLSARDPLFILPVLNGVFMILTQRMTPTPGMDPMQKKVMSALPIVFSVMFAFFPAGLVLYWATNAGLSLLQQWYITRKITAST